MYAGTEKFGVGALLFVFLCLLSFGALELSLYTLLVPFICILNFLLIPLSPPKPIMSDNGFSYTAPVTVVGAGPVGLVTALTLAKHGIRCNLVEKRLEATLWPKMDMTNSRSMELLDRLGLAEEFRQIGKRT